MSSEFAEFLCSFASNKLQSSPQLDLRQRLLHSNLIRHILLTYHQPSSTSSSTSSSSSSPSSSTAAATSDPSSSTPSKDQPQSLCLPPLPPSPPLSPVPQSHYYVFASPSAPFQTFPPHSDTPVLGQIHSNWTPFSFDDELDRIHSRQSLDGNLFQDLDVDMEEDPSDPTLYLGQNDNNYDTNLRFGFHPYFAEPHPHMEDHDFESNQAQKDWLDAVLEDLMEEDEQEDSSPDYDSDDDNDSFEEKELDINVTRGSSTPAVVLVAHKMDNEEDAILGRLLDQSGQHLKQNHHHYQQHQQHQQHQQQQDHPHPSPSATCSSLLHPCQSIDMYESPHPYHKSYLQQSFSIKEKGSTGATSTVGSKASNASATTATSVPVSGSLMAQGAPQDEPMLPQDHVNRIKQQQQQRQLQLQNPSYFPDDAYYRSCPPCLGFHSSFCSYPQKEQNEDDLREQRFVKLTQELGSALVQEQEADPNPNLLLPEQQSFKGSFLFRSSAISPALGH
ncbi:hypothetical protein BGZ79_010474 [Entomortierella chlamydospora]|nr:hypothetical protein BGZ79_010474 [Entomortierella chlamydospora]